MLGGPSQPWGLAWSDGRVTKAVEGLGGSGVGTWRGLGRGWGGVGRGVTRGRPSILHLLPLFTDCLLSVQPSWESLNPTSDFLVAYPLQKF